MEFKDYLKEQIKKVDNEDDLILLIYFDENVQFKYHKGCFADFQENFCILYDGDVNMAFRYNSVKMLQIGDINEMKSEMAEQLMKALIEGMK